MTPRIVIPTVAPQAYQAMMNLEKYISTTSLTSVHKELIKIRASQINGCAYCINMHTADARKYGVSEQWIYLLSAWREADVYTEEEKAILALTEQVTMISNHVSDEVYQNAARLFDEKYLAEIIMMIITINAWNRIGVTTGMRAS
ncbi:carboxymuconolactone decarboxylase family protein [Flavobacterium sp. MDT1-60]|uniref:carboxymuconolactone decarboxylase family protein n=1 Tax=Flavobacterium sp. MDT1-60 TaxID=1979344 RepID=UPI001780AAF8|nr:carboxymuconolactone decarboxylase family protein [Flavobacterium sp. MDT1-60]QOG04041.1 carboxymuconolactone decarboxylase family protein [Flavobacterium sp. MDT1-60]